MKSSSLRLPRRRDGMVLLVVLGMLTFFSILAASYLVFTNQSRHAAHMIALRSTSSPDPNALLDQALMKLIVGTNDPTDTFYGEDLLSDYYGRYDAIDPVRDGIGQPAINVLTDSGFQYYAGAGFIRIPITASGFRAVDDLFTGRIITFVQNPSSPLHHRSFRVLRSFLRTQGTNRYHSLVVQLPEDLIFRGQSVTEPDLSIMIRAAGVPYFNGVPRNSAGFGFDTSYATQTIGGANDGFVLPRALQPNLFGTYNSKIASATPGDHGDFDEAYDGADFQNWYLSHRDSSTGAVAITPSFHRPAVINYILNDINVRSNFNDLAGRRDLVRSLARGTFRPLPIAFSQVGTQHVRFTGSTSHYGLRAPINLDLGAVQARFRVDQLAKALIGDHIDLTDPLARNPWDVDNDKDGIPDSIWIDLGLPLIQSQEGKLLRPLVAVMIEDLSARLNVNAHGNLELPHDSTAGGASERATWAKSRIALPDNTLLDTANNINPAFRGLGYGPAEITIPTWTAASAVVNAALLDLRRARYQPGNRADLPAPQPGDQGIDDWMLVRQGSRPGTHRSLVGQGYSVDPFGRGVMGIGRGGHLLSAGAGAVTSTSTVSNESVNTPYDFDPSGRFAGDRIFSFDELEPLLRSNTFDMELLPANLSGRLLRMMEENPAYENAFTTASVSDDSLLLPPRPGQSLLHHTSLEAIVDLLAPGVAGTLTDAQLDQWVKRLIAPEFRLGRKLDVNRALGNGVDDNGNGVIDEPAETESRGAFAVHSDITTESPPENILPSAYQSIAPNYSLGDVTDGLPTDPRPLLARHLYVLMMGLARDATFAGFDPAVPMDEGVLADYRARRIAQWAVNVVDYRDADSIMTRFHYDPNPFDSNGWNPPVGPQYVVWGVEQPELVFSESLAMHDTRVRDTQRDLEGGHSKTSSPDADPDTDQVRIPQGSLFLELYAPRTTLDPTNFDSGNPTAPSHRTDQHSKQGAPREFYSEVTANDARTLALRLDALAPNNVPVWRLAISEPHTTFTDVGSGDPAHHDNSPLVRRATHPDTTSFEPTAMDDLDPAVALPLERYVWFRKFANPAALTAATGLVAGMSDTNTFFVPNLTGAAASINAGDVTVAPGQFLTLSPRTLTQLGSNVFSGDAPERPSRERFETIAGQGVVYFNRQGTTGTRLTPTFGTAAANPFAPAKPLVIGTFTPGSGWEDAFVDDFVGLNVSEPMPRSGNYYPLPTDRYAGTTNANYPLRDAYVDLTTAGTMTALARPQDVGRGRIPAVPGTGSAPTPNDEPFLGGIPNYCTVFLQRLADPTMPYDPTTNPYRSVDWISVDLNVISGEEEDTNVNVGGSDYLTRSRQRNGRGSGAMGIDTRDVLFSYETNDVASETAALEIPESNEPYFRLALPATHVRHSLSFLNTRFPIGVTGIAAINENFDGFSPSIGMTRGLAPNVPDGAPGVTTFDRNLPQVPYAQHPWLNRNFASPLELMMVPASSAGRLFEEFSIPARSVNDDPEVYAEASPVRTNTGSMQRFHGPFRHLLNFFYGDTRETVTGVDAQMKLAELSRLFDFVHTLPPYRGEVELLLPGRGVTLSPDHLHLAPFNFLYDNRRQGRINLNTLADFPVWVGLMQGHMSGTESTVAAAPGQLAYRQFVANRRGYQVAGGNPITVMDAAPTINYDRSRFDPGLPTEFAGLYRNHLASAHGMQVRDASHVLGSRAADASFLRRDDWLTDPAPSSEDPLFVRRLDQQPAEPPVPTQPTTASEATMLTGNHSTSRFRNAFLRYQTAMRMPNLAADNSQLYLVRMTIGLFESDTTGQLGREYNEEMGQNRRFEAMFIIDRSRPVGFIPGQTLNARDVVVFEKYYQ